MNLIILILLIMFLTLITALVIIFWQDILMILYPDKYLKDIFLESDDNIRIITFKKQDNGKQRIKEGNYNMFYGSEVDDGRKKETVDSAQTNDEWG